jgi:hypothetical protein
MRGRGNRKSTTSRCGDIVVTGDLGYIASRYEELARNQQNEAIHHLFLNYAEHYRKVMRGESCA